jgi:hypothetical protein
LHQGRVETVKVLTSLDGCSGGCAHFNLAQYGVQGGLWFLVFIAGFRPGTQFKNRVFEQTDHLGAARVVPGFLQQRGVWEFPDNSESQDILIETFHALQIFHTERRLSWWLGNGPFAHGSLQAARVCGSFRMGGFEAGSVLIDTARVPTSNQPFVVCIKVFCFLILVIDFAVPGGDSSLSI